MLRFLTAGESHGPAEVAILEGTPAGLAITTDDIQKELDKRKGGAGRGGRGLIEDDKVRILSGVRNGITIGSPIALLIENLDYKNWKNKKNDEITNPRPGHADFAGSAKYGFSDIRNVIERSSARETVMRVAIGSITKKLLLDVNIQVASHTVSIGYIHLRRQVKNFKEVWEVHKNDPEIHCIDPKTSLEMKDVIKQATVRKDTLGGVVEIIAHNVPVGLGSYVHYDRKLDGRLASILMSIPSVKGVEIGDGFSSASCFGSQIHDGLYWENGSYVRRTNQAGGIEGGVTNGEDIICRVYHKPISTLGLPIDTVDIKTKKPTKALIERSDVCVVPRAGVISESMVAFVLADSFLEKFGADSMKNIKKSYREYLKQVVK